MPTKPMLILVAGPYRSGTGDDPTLIAANMRAMTEAALAVFGLGHIPLTGEALALPMIAAAGSQAMGDAVWNDIFHPLAERLVVRCDAVLRIGGASVGADHMVALAQSAGVQVFTALDQIDTAE